MNPLLLLLIPFAGKSQKKMSYLAQKIRIFRTYFCTSKKAIRITDTKRIMGTKTNIMIIDDSYTNRVLLKAVLDDLEIDVIEVHSGMKALRLLKDYTPHMILLDMCMPQMNGLDFLQELKKLDKKIPVIVISVLDDQTYINQALQNGANEYLLKPLDSNKLLSAISKHAEVELPN